LKLNEAIAFLFNTIEGKLMGRLFGVHLDDRDPDGLDAHKPGAKLDAGKPRMTLVLKNFRQALALVGRVGTYGANKYSDNGWVFVNNGVERYSDALFRHLLEEEYDLQLDPESKIPHAAHAAWNALARLELMLRQELEADSEVGEAPHNVKRCRDYLEVTWQEFLDSLDEARENDRPESWVQHLRDNLPMNSRLEYLLNHGTKGAAEDAEVEKLQEEDAVMRGWKGDMPLSEVEETARLWEEMIDNYDDEYPAEEALPLPCPYLEKMLETGWSSSNASAVRWHIRQEAKRRGWVLKTRLTEALNAAIADEQKLIAREEKIKRDEEIRRRLHEMREKAKALAWELAAKAREEKPMRDQLDRPRFDDTVKPEFKEVRPEPLKTIEENARFLQEAKAERAIELELESALQKQKDVQDLISEHNQAAIADRKVPSLDLQALSPDEVLEARKEICDKDHHGLWFDDEDDDD
jgi:hypothetical protein